MVLTGAAFYHKVKTLLLIKKERKYIILNYINAFIVLESSLHIYYA